MSLVIKGAVQTHFRVAKWVWEACFFEYGVKARVVVTAASD